MMRSKPACFAEQDACTDALLGLYSLAHDARTQIQRAAITNPDCEQSDSSDAQQDPVLDLLLGLYAVAERIESLIDGAIATGNEPDPERAAHSTHLRGLLR